MLPLASVFASLLDKHKSLANTLSHKIDLIIPMHSAKLKIRGFNQSLELARIISKNTKISLDYNTCQRVRYTPTQPSLPLKERIKNIRGAFNCQQKLYSKNIAIIDVVMTSGASLNELAKTLKEAGAAHVECWVVARTLAKLHD